MSMDLYNPVAWFYTGEVKVNFGNFVNMGRERLTNYRRLDTTQIQNLHNAITAEMYFTVHE